ncbi:MAG: HAMP domain-containing histidine kinase, partial [Myxococcales bacterium]|nr:HAMP domain-containing histidine kinase [Myxococcales bacterium]
AATPAADVASLLELLAPTVALALDNALANRELEAYQVDLERLVDARTAELTVARDDLAATVDQLRVAQASRERIFGNISHEIRTPLSLILLAIADVERRAGAELDERARADLAGVVDSARRLLRLVDELLLLAAGRETALAVVPESVDVGVLVRNLVATWVPAAEQAGLTLRCLGPTTLGAEVDAVAFERVLSNLLSNAVKFTPAGGQIAVELGGDDDRLRLSVRDTGVGIDDELLTRLFGRFERGRGAATGKSGSGIGLSLVKQLVEAHGGAIHVERLRAGGTEFRVELPRGTPGAMLTDAAPQLRPSDYGLAAATVSSGEILSPPGTVKGSILVAEDNPRLAAQVARLLAEDHVVIVALDGLAAQDLAARHRPHLLVTDVDMPGMDGIELARRFRELTGDALAPVVILSALADPGTRLAGLDAGAVDYVVKPFDPRELLARVRAQFRGRELAARLQRAEQLSALGTLSSGLAHELRNPANAIVNAVGPLRRLLPAEVIRSDTPAGQLFDVLAGCAEQIAFISRHLLGFRRGGDLELRGAAVGDVVRRAITLAQPALAGVDVREAYDPLLPVWCAPPLLVQVLVNLIGNAGQAVGAGGWVEVGAREVDDRLVIEVADSGAGVPPELRERIFEPFFTTKDPGKGTGLGLALARDIVHRHHGVLELRERGGRSVFAIDLPGRAAAEAAS